MRRTAIATMLALAAFLAPSGANAARSRHASPAKCAPSRHTLLADPQAQVYSTPEDIDGVISLRACVYGQRKSLLVHLCTSGEERIGPTECIKDHHVTLTGTFVAYEYAIVSSGKYPPPEGQEEQYVSEHYVVVRDLRTGRIFRKVPTGIPLVAPEPRHVGVGNLQALVLKNDGSVAWIAEDDYKHNPPGTVPPPVEKPFYDVYASDKPGTRLLASGTNVDPSSLALGGSIVYWTQGGKAASATLQ